MHSKINYKKISLIQKNTILLVVLCINTACNPLGERQAATQQAIAVADMKARKINKKYEPDIREIKPYKVYSYQSDLKDPFQLRQFVIKETDVSEIDFTPVAQPRCIPPICVPPKPHARQFLENYGIENLSFVGTLGFGSGVALIKTPDLGVVSAKVGDYMGENNGVILEIRENAVILQEKLPRNGLWENKKTVLTIR